MPDQSFGTWLRRERERRGTTLKAISDQTKVSQALLQGLEAGDLSRWPAGIFRRAFVRSYASAAGLDPDDVIKRFEQEHGDTVPPPDGPTQTSEGIATANALKTAALESGRDRKAPALPAGGPALQARGRRARLLGTAADLSVALVLGLGCAAADSRMLWPVLLIAAYYALGVVLTGTSPMVALLTYPQTSTEGGLPAAPSPPRPGGEQRHASRRGATRSAPSSRSVRQHVQQKV